MLQWYHETLAVLALAALVASWDLPRCRLWVGIVAASYVASVVYFHMTPIPGVWAPYGAAVAFFCDAAVYLVIRETHREKWEMRGLGSVMMTTATLTALRTLGWAFGWPPVLAHAIYSGLLEVANAVYLLLIIGMGTLARVESLGHRDGAAGHRGLGAAFLERARQRSKVSQPLRTWTGH